MRNEKGVAQILVLVLLLVGLGAGVYLVKQQTNIFPKAYTPRPSVRPSLPPLAKPIPGEFSDLSANLASDEARFNFNYASKSADFKVELSTSADFSGDIDTNFGSGPISPITVKNPQKRWDKYRCDTIVYWRLRNANQTAQSSIQTTTVSCSRVISTPKPSCLPRPACLDKSPRCLLAEPKNGWCPASTPTSIPYGGTGGSNGSPSSGVSRVSR